MRVVLHLIAFAAAGAAIVYFGSGRSLTAAHSPVAPAAVPIRADDNSRLSKQVEALQREVVALKSQVARPSDSGASSSAQPPTELTTEAERAVEAERHRVYMVGVAQAFAAEQVDLKWAGYASSRLVTTLQEDDVLRTAAHDFECRQQTCRLQIEDDGSGKLSQRLTMMSLRLMDVFPSATAELVDQGNGRNALVLYMSSQPTASPAGPAK
jgi:hypothetical protein